MRAQGNRIRKQKNNNAYTCTEFTACIAASHAIAACLAYARHRASSAASPALANLPRPLTNATRDPKSTLHRRSAHETSKSREFSRFRKLQGPGSSYAAALNTAMRFYLWVAKASEIARATKLHTTRMYINGDASSSEPETKTQISRYPPPVRAGLAKKSCRQETAFPMT
ncbi:hypothetical protein ACJJTC_019197 [Scirpophaga incertulas]